MNSIRKKITFYAPSIVLGLSDAVVSIVGSLAGMSWAFARTETVALAGILIGLSASFSMGSAEYLSAREENDERDPVLAALFTGGTFFIVATLLVFPYVFLGSATTAFITSVAIAIIVLMVYSFGMTKMQGGKLGPRFFTMFFMALLTTIATFIFSVIVKELTGLDI